MIVEHPDQTLTSNDRHIVGKSCLNCGGQVIGRYCHNCGQHIGEHNKGLWAFISEFLEEFIRVDSKFLRTLSPLIVRPGWLTQQWVAGKRVRFITPLKLYISLSAICFLLISITASPTVITATPDDKPRSRLRHGISQGDLAKMSPFERAIMEPVSKLTVDGPEGEANRRQFGEKFLSGLSTMNLFLLPIFALLFKMLYIRRSRFYVEHLVFALHYYAFFSLATSAWILFSKIPPIPIYGMHTAVLLGDILIVPVAIWMVAYLPIAMFVNYGQGIFKTLVKCWIFCSIYLVAVAVVLTAMVFLALFQMGPVSSTKVSGKAPTVNKTINP